MAAILQVPTSNSLNYTLDSGYSVSGTTLVLNQSVAGTVQAPGICVVDRIDSQGSATPSKRTYYKFTGVSSATLTGVTLADGTDQSHSIGAIVEFVPDVKWAQSIYDGLTKIVSGSTGNLDTTKVVDLTTAQVLTNKDLSSGTNTLPVTLTNTVTLTNKRISKRVDSQATTNTITPEPSTYDIFRRTAQAHALVINNHSTSTPTDGEMILFEITSDATPRAITYGNMYVALAGTALPTTTTASKTTTMLFIWIADLTQWNIVYAGTQA